MTRVLIIDDDEDFLSSIRRALAKEFEVLTASHPEDALALLAKRPEAVLLDVRLNEGQPDDRSGLELLVQIKEHDAHLPIIMMTAYGQVEVAVEAMKRGAVDFVEKDRIALLEFNKVLRNALARRNLERKVQSLEEDLQRISPWKMVGETPAIENVKRMVEIAARDSVASVLIDGETGTGKELVARMIHAESARSEGPFVPVCISSLNTGTLESELFGHERGAFTGADSSKLGYFERGDRGVLFLDEIGELQPDSQVKLLRFLEERTLTRVGGSSEIPVDAQLIFATNRDLGEAVQRGDFREDLYYRLRTLHIRVPPLRERIDDVPLLADYFLRLFHQQGRSRATAFDADAVQKMLAYHWPGNVREMRSAIERAVIVSAVDGSSTVGAAALPYEVGQSETDWSANGVGGVNEETNVDLELARLELSYVDKALRLSQGKKEETWRLLGYKNRHALLRRVSRALNKFPALKREFTEVARHY